MVAIVVVVAVKVHDTMFEPVPHVTQLGVLAVDNAYVALHEVRVTAEVLVGVQVMAFTSTPVLVVVHETQTEVVAQYP